MSESRSNREVQGRRLLPALIALLGIWILATVVGSVLFGGGFRWTKVLLAATPGAVLIAVWLISINRRFG
ncbi:MAG: hypothetical protein R3C03_08825 [Pirellulaceae bacterium]